MERDVWQARMDSRSTNDGTTQTALKKILERKVPYRNLKLIHLQWFVVALDEFSEFLDPLSYQNINIYIMHPQNMPQDEVLFISITWTYTSKMISRKHQKPCTLVELSQKTCHKLPSWEPLSHRPILTALLSRWLSFSWWGMDSFLAITWVNFPKGQISEAFQQSFMSAMSHCTSGVTVYTSNFR